MVYEIAVRGTVYTATVSQAAGSYVAECREIQVSAQASTKTDALHALRQALEFHGGCDMCGDGKHLRSAHEDIRETVRALIRALDDERIGEAKRWALELRRKVNGEV